MKVCEQRIYVPIGFLVACIFGDNFRHHFMDYYLFELFTIFLCHESARDIQSILAIQEPSSAIHNSTYYIYTIEQLYADQVSISTMHLA